VAAIGEATVIKAVCPTCTKVVVVAGDSSPIAGRLVRHRSPAGGMCGAGGVHKARICDLAPPCVDCAALPALPPNGATGAEWNQELRPPRPRAATGRPPRCFAHKRTHQKALRAARNGRARERARGFPEVDRAALWTAQGEACGICGVPLNVERKAPELDHDHDRAAEHDHAPDQVCRACVRGLLCRTCNLHVVGRLTRVALMRALRWHEINTAVDLGWWDDKESGS
jgi:hypothetical protein